MIVYIVTEGEYSDYSIVAVCSTLEIAEAMVKVLNRREYPSATCEEWAVDEEMPRDDLWTVRMYSDPSGEANPASSFDKKGLHFHAPSARERPTRRPGDDPINLPRYCRVTGSVTADSAEHALKIAGEFLSRRMAELPPPAPEVVQPLELKEGWSKPEEKP